MKKLIITASIVLLAFQITFSQRSVMRKTVKGFGPKKVQAQSKTTSNHFLKNSANSVNKSKSISDTAYFEDTSFPDQGWSIEYTGTNFWSQENGNGPSIIGSKAARFDCWNAVPGIEQSIVSPDIPALSAGNFLFFDVAHAPYSESWVMENDSLTVLYSTDGINYQVLSQYSGNTGIGTGIQTAEPAGTSFIPRADQWATIKVPIPQGTVKYKLKVTSGYGNEIWIDNVYCGQPKLNDLQLDAIIIPQGLHFPGNSQIQAVIKNRGINTISSGQVVKFYVDNNFAGTANTYTALQNDESETVELNINFSSLGIYNVSASVSSDDNNNNDSLSTKFYVENPNYYIESFESGFPPSDWIEQGQWGLAYSSGYAYDGSVSCLFYPDTADLMILPKLHVTAGDYIACYATTWAKSDWPSVKIVYSSDMNSWTDLSAQPIVLNNSYVRIQENIPFSGDYYFALACNNKSNTEALYDLFIAPPKVIFPKDGTVLGTLTLPSGCNLGLDTLTVLIENVGLDTLRNFPIVYNVNYTTNITDTVHSSIAPGDTLKFSFSKPIDFSAPGQYSILIKTEIANDGDLRNDSIRTYTTSIAPASIPFVDGFNTSDDWNGWQMYNPNGYSSWADGVNFGFNGSGSAYYGSFNTKNDDWLMSGCIDFTGGNTYHLSFYSKIGSISDPEDIEIKLCKNNIPDVTDSTISPLITTTDTLFDLKSFTFTVPVTGTYYIGFHDITQTFSDELVIDSLTIDITTGIHENNNMQAIKVYPNPASDKIEVSVPEFSEIEISNIEGQLVKKVDADEGHTSIDISELTKGLYILKAKTNDGIIVKKFIKE